MALRSQDSLFHFRNQEIQMKISVIVPYYNPENDLNTEDLLIRAVMSALNNLKGVCDHEVLIVDDGSPYEPDLDTLSDPAIRYIRRPHGMLGAARNTGIENATGDVISFLDADDYYYPGALAPCIKAMEQNSADLVGFGIRTTKSGNGIDRLSSGKPVFSAPMTGDEYMCRNNLYGSACRYLIRSSLIRNNGLRFVENAFIEDEEFVPRLFFYTWRYINTTFPVYAYYIHSGSIITSDSAQRIEQKSDHTIMALKSLLQFRDEHIHEPHEGFDRKIHTLAIDHLRRTLRRIDWRSALPQQMDTLRQMGLYPLHLHGIPFKFWIFAGLTGNRPGQYILHVIEFFYK